MSWKNFACVAALSALIASPALAVPSLSVDLVRDGGGLAVLDSNGDWQWEVSVVTDADGSTASELEGTFTDSALVSGALGNTTVFDTPNPSPSALAWISEDVDGILTGGLQTNVPTNESVIAVGSDDVVAGTYLLATFVTEGPSTAGSLTSSVSLTGNIAQLGANNAVSASLSKTALAGDANLDGDVNFQDASILSTNYNGSGTWAAGDFNGDGSITFQDASVLSTNYNASGTAPANAVPEPTSLVLLGIAGVAFVAARRQS